MREAAFHPPRAADLPINATAASRFDPTSAINSLVEGLTVLVGFFSASPICESPASVGTRMDCRTCSPNCWQLHKTHVSPQTCIYSATLEGSPLDCRLPAKSPAIGRCVCRNPLDRQRVPFVGRNKDEYSSEHSSSLFGLSWEPALYSTSGTKHQVLNSE